MTKPASFITVERLWQFSLQYYAMRGVKEACLSLQNNFDGNVNLLLLLKCLDEQQLTFHRNDWSQVQQALLRTETLLLHYRKLRKKTKSHVPATLYRESLEFELLLEKQQQSDLVQCINTLELTTNNKEPLTLAYCRSLNAEHLFTATFAKHSTKTSS
ncbi:TIGR02444 family protein [Vibrio sp. MA40-2]|uniref:TIGR02444 family protein n=1 Tax=Vibrio sp. MA40-2 TaxID=3391828 RepID=UPI0039A73A32